jgi:hypothetical protein
LSVTGGQAFLSVTGGQAFLPGTGGQAFLPAATFLSFRSSASERTFPLVPKLCFGTDFREAPLRLSGGAAMSRVSAPNTALCPKPAIRSNIKPHAFLLRRRPGR